MKNGNKNKVIYYVLGATALATGIYYISSKDEVKKIIDAIKYKFKIKK
jgi:hypothetical protein